jgi:hypothetical protein
MTASKMAVKMHRETRHDSQSRQFGDNSALAAPEGAAYVNPENPFV